MDNEIKQNMPVKTTLHKDSNIDALRLEQAWEWLCESRKTAPANADIWDLRHRWSTYRETFLRQLQSGDYRLSPMLVVGSRRLAMWSAEDALALKWVALAITEHLLLHEKYEHVKGHGGGKSSIQRVSQNLTDSGYRWVCRTDIKGYYGAINKDTLLSQLRQHLHSPVYLNILTQYIHYSVEDGGEFCTPSQGIAQGCALSPLVGALHLWAVDNFFAQQKKCYYGRYMDDFVILTRSRWQLRKQVKQLNEYLASMGFQKHPDKTFIGKVSNGFDWLGVWLTDKGITGVAPRALANHLEKVRRLYEQTRHWPAKRQARRVSAYCSRWKIWAVAMIFTSPTYGLQINRGETVSGIASASWAPYSSNPPTTVSGGESYGSGFAINIAPNLYGRCASPTTLGLSTTSDGYSGILVGPDIVLGLTGTASGPDINGLSGTLARWSATGTYTPEHPNINGLTWCGIQQPSTVPYIRGSTLPAQFSGSYIIHVGSKALSGDYTTPALYLTHTLASSWSKPAPKLMVAPVSFTVSPPTSCTLSLGDPDVPFASIEQSSADGTVLAQYLSSLNVSCSDADNVPMTITATGNGGRSVDTLSLLGTVGQGSLAEVRGAMVATSASPCDTDTNRLLFDGTPVSIGNISSGQTAIPLLWTLCSNGSGLKGAGQAQATINLNWP